MLPRELRIALTPIRTSASRMRLFQFSNSFYFPVRAAELQRVSGYKTPLGPQIRRDTWLVSLILQTTTQRTARLVHASRRRLSVQAVRRDKLRGTFPGIYELSSTE